MWTKVGNKQAQSVTYFYLHVLDKREHRLKFIPQTICKAQILIFRQKSEVLLWQFLELDADKPQALSTLFFEFLVLLWDISFCIYMFRVRLKIKPSLHCQLQ